MLMIHPLVLHEESQKDYLLICELHDWAIMLSKERLIDVTITYTKEVWRRVNGSLSDTPLQKRAGNRLEP